MKNEDELEGEDEDFIRCPFCAEDIRVEAILCRHCESMLQSFRAELGQ